MLLDPTIALPPGVHLVELCPQASEVFSVGSKIAAHPQARYLRTLTQLAEIGCGRCVAEESDSGHEPGDVEASATGAAFPANS